MTSCLVCERKGGVSGGLGVCRECICRNWEKAKRVVFKAHKRARKRFSLPFPPPKNPKGVRCSLCVNQCRIKEGKISFCGLRTNKRGRLVHLGGTPEKGILHFYFDPLPTNCVASWVCPGSKVYGKKNLAVFYGACSLDCLFCQNWHFRSLTKDLSPKVSAKELVNQVDIDTFCLCFFGGDPTPQMPHALETAKRILEKHLQVRICFETNGSMNPNLAKEMAKLSLKTQGIVKFDLKAYEERLHFALTGVSNKWTLQNFAMLAKEFLPQANYPFLVASTLLIPGYIGEKEVGQIAQFIARLNPQIPYSLLAFYPCFELSDLPPTSRELALKCLRAAQKAGLRNIHLGNIHLLI